MIASAIATSTLNESPSADALSRTTPPCLTAHAAATKLPQLASVAVTHFAGGGIIVARETVTRV